MAAYELPVGWVVPREGALHQHAVVGSVVRSGHLVGSLVGIQTPQRRRTFR